MKFYAFKLITLQGGRWEGKWEDNLFPSHMREGKSPKKISSSLPTAATLKIFAVASKFIHDHLLSHNVVYRSRVLHSSRTRRKRTVVMLMTMFVSLSIDRERARFAYFELFEVIGFFRLAAISRGAACSGAK